jgi:hypothetical protein
LLQATGICATTRTSDLYRPSPADGRGLDRLAVAQHGEQRQHAVMREVNLIDLVARFEHHQPLRQLHGREVRQQPIEVIARQRGEELIVQGKTGV